MIKCKILIISTYLNQLSVVVVVIVVVVVVVVEFVEPEVADPREFLCQDRYCLKIMHEINIWTIACLKKTRGKFKQEAKWPHRAPDKPFKSTNIFEQSYEYIITLNTRGINHDHLFEN